MACTGGCVNGGGQPIVSAKVMDTVDVRNYEPRHCTILMIIKP